MAQLRIQRSRLDCKPHANPNSQGLSWRHPLRQEEPPRRNEIWQRRLLHGMPLVHQNQSPNSTNSNTLPFCTYVVTSTQQTTTQTPVTSHPTHLPPHCLKFSSIECHSSAPQLPRTRNHTDSITNHNERPLNPNRHNKANTNTLQHK